MNINLFRLVYFNTNSKMYSLKKTLTKLMNRLELEGLFTAYQQLAVYVMPEIILRM